MSQLTNNNCVILWYDLVCDEVWTGSGSAVQQQNYAELIVHNADCRKT